MLGTNSEFDSLLYGSLIETKITVMNRLPSESRLRIIVLGSLVRLPLGGLAWHYLNYVHGLAEMGHDVYYVEDSYDRPACFGPDSSGPTTNADYGLRFSSQAFSRLGLADRWAYYDAHTNEWKGPRASDAVTLCKTADFVLHISGLNPLRDWLSGVPVRALIDTDPGFTQIRNLTNPIYRHRCDEHTDFFSFGANIGKPTCSIPDDGFLWQPTRQPVSLAVWPHRVAPRRGPYTTVMSWESFDIPFEFGDLRLGMKSESFNKLIELPSRVGRIFDLAVRTNSATSTTVLQHAGWGLADIDLVSCDPWSYQAFIQRSRAEFGVAKAGYARTRSGWFSERSAVYLASGRPVLHQDTEFCRWLPTGEGILSFHTLEDVVDAVRRLEADYELHCRRARELAIEYFAAPRVLKSLIESVGSKPSGLTDKSCPVELAR
jgi:hypothetical protein